MAVVMPRPAMASAITDFLMIKGIWKGEYSGVGGWVVPEAGKAGVLQERNTPLVANIRMTQPSVQVLCQETTILPLIFKLPLLVEFKG